jgi:hypothetical protein
MASRLSLVTLWLLIGAVSCVGDGVRRFPVRDPLWVDPDTGSIAGKPAPRKVSWYGNVSDSTVLRPLSRALTLPLPTRALNVNTLDEVPNSSWFTNRIGVFPMSPDEVARGACGDLPPLDPARGPWTISSGKTNGSHPGFVIKAPDGYRYLIKFDGPLMSQRATSADVVGSKIYHAAGFFTPCNEIVYFPEDILRLGATAKRKDDYGHDLALTASDVQAILAAAWRTPDGRVRALASRYLAGEPLGPFSYEGVRPDDPNDVVPHQMRRELRGSRLFAAWLHHWDALEANTLDVLVDEGGRRYVRHNILDWGDALGDIWTWTWRRFNPRVGTGRSGYVDLDLAVGDFVTLGLLQRPWYHPAPPPPQPETFGYFDSQSFVPGEWRGTYGNPAFKEMTSGDALWAVRIIARFRDEHIAAIVARAHIDDPAAARYLADTLMARRDRILQDYLTRFTPLDRFVLSRQAPKSAQSLCFEDLAIATGVAAPQSTMYRIHLHAGPRLEQLFGWRQVRPDPSHPSQTCTELPLGPLRPAALAGAAAADDDPRRYATLEIYSNQTPSLQATAMVVLHLVDLGDERGFRLIGIERPDAVKDPP